MLRSVDRMMRPAVDETIRALKLEDEDAAAVRLAEQYADAIDSARDAAWAMRWLGPLLLQCLAELGATPAARKGLKKDLNVTYENRLTALRAARN